MAIFGIGGVGGYVCEALVRAGVGHFELFDHDVVDVTNLNRQIIATHSTIGRKKVEVMKERMLDINPEVDVVIHDCFYLPENASEFPFDAFDYVVDCVDTVTAKLEIITRCNAEKIPVISSMGTGNKLEPTKLEVSDIYKTSVCPLARIMRYELKKRNVKELKVVFSKEEPVKIPEERQKFSSSNKPIPGSISFVPSSAGLIIASEIIKDIINS